MNKLILFISIFFTLNCFAQKVIDRVDAIVGNEIILTSDIETQYQQYLTQDIPIEARLGVRLLKIYCIRNCF